MIAEIIDFFLRIDEHLLSIVQNFGVFSYFLIFLIIFLETGIVITPILPGESLLFAAGALASQGILNIYFLLILLSIAAILGDTVNYSIGRYLGISALNKKWIKQKYVEKTESFYMKYGNKTIVFARFIPIVRTFAPFLAGIGKMDYSKFLFYNIIGGLAWVFIAVLAGFFFGNIPIVRENFTLVILGIIFVSLLPIVFHVLSEKFKR